MDHVAIMRKSWHLTERILSGEKKIESRWYKFKRSPWNKIKINNSLYFKNSGEQVSLKARVSKVLQFSNLNPSKVKELLLSFGKDVGIRNNEISSYYKMFKDKKYCVLIFLKEIQLVKSFNINKNGFGAMSSWISVENIEKIKV